MIYETNVDLSRDNKWFVIIEMAKNVFESLIDNVRHI